MNDFTTPEEVTAAAAKFNQQRRETFPRRETDENVYIDKAKASQSEILDSLAGHWTDDSPTHRSYIVEGFKGSRGTYDIRVNDNGEFGMTVNVREKEKGWPTHINDTRIVWDSHGVDYESKHSIVGVPVRSSTVASFHTGQVYNPEEGLSDIHEARDLIKETVDATKFEVLRAKFAELAQGELAERIRLLEGKGGDSPVGHIDIWRSPKMDGLVNINAFRDTEAQDGTRTTEIEQFHYHQGEGGQITSVGYYHIIDRFPPSPAERSYQIYNYWIDSPSFRDTSNYHEYGEADVDVPQRLDEFLAAVKQAA